MVCPSQTNPADYYMRVLAVNYPKQEADEKQVKFIVDHYEKNIAGNIMKEAQQV